MYDLMFKTDLAFNFTCNYNNSTSLVTITIDMATIQSQDLFSRTPQN